MITLGSPIKDFEQKLFKDIAQHPVVSRIVETGGSNFRRHIEKSLKVILAHWPHLGDTVGEALKDLWFEVMQITEEAKDRFNSDDSGWVGWEDYRAKVVSEELEKIAGRVSHQF